MFMGNSGTLGHPWGNVWPVRAPRMPGALPLCLSILSLAPSLSSPREVPQVDRTRPQPSLQGTLYKPKYEDSTTQNVTPTTSNHHPCHRQKPGAKDGPDA